MAARRAFGCR